MSSNEVQREPRTAIARFAAALDRGDVEAERADLAHDLAIAAALVGARPALDPEPAARAAAKDRLLALLAARDSAAPAAPRVRRSARHAS